MAMVLAKFSPQTGFTSLIRFGETWQNRRHSALQNLPIATALRRALAPIADRIPDPLVDPFR
jgi:hypothetical protein